MPTTTGTNGDDTINGTGGDDTVDSGNGNDTVNGGGGDDTIDGGNGNDTIDGGGDDDTIDGGNGNDVISGGDGDDILDGGNGNDVIMGNGGNDNIHGSNGNDDIIGGAGDDIIDGDNGFDTARYSGAIGEYTFFNLGGYLHIVHLGGAGADGHDQVKRVERLVFADRTITIGSGNNAPVAVDDHVSINEDTGTYSSGAASVKDNDFDFDGDTMTVTPGVFVGTYGTLTLNANGTYSYTLNASAQALAQGQNVTDSFNYTLSDNDGSDTGALVFHIAGVNDAPVANPDTNAGDPVVESGVNPGNTPFAGDPSATGNVLTNDTDVDAGDTKTVSAVNGSGANVGAAVAGTYGSVTIASNGSYTYTLNNADPDTNALAQGASVNEVFTYTVQDANGATSTTTLTITITGTNDAPVAVADTNGGDPVVESGVNPGNTPFAGDPSAAGNVLTNDTDVDSGDTKTVSAVNGSGANVGAAVAGTYGSVTIASNGSYTYTLNNADFDTNALAQGASANEVFTYTVQDAHGASSTTTLTITITGTNDGPVAAADTATTSENATVLINVLVNDSDVDTGATLLVSGASSTGGGTAAVVSNQVQFDPGTDFDYLAVGESVNVVVNYDIQDEHGATASSTVTVTVTGTNDGPTINAGGTDASGSVTELPNNAPGENTFVHQDSGTVAFNDLDLSDTHSASFTPQGGGYLGTFTLDPVNQAGDDVEWHFSVSDAALDSLDAGDTLTQIYTIEIDDGHGGTTTQDVTITINGASDNLPPDAVNDSYNAFGNVTLTVNAAQGVLANDTDDAGVGTGPGQANVTAFDATSANGGTISMNPDGSFSYTSAAGFNGTDTFTYTLTDAEGETDVATVTVSVGQSVWFIDNAAVGSANTGTQEDPFTSMASFNAAQGTLNGPAAGETIYLREGTGTYSEADGINLLNGQTLVGGGENLVIGATTIETGTGRPTIVVTGAGNDGIDVAQNNTVSGFDIGATTRAGISDSGGTVGNLTVFDVGKSGSGQIADIDQGGTLNVTLNSASSTGSTGGAIDLDGGLGGNFAVTGATSITGSQAGGGLDATANVNLHVSFQGGLTASTGSAVAVRFTTNTGTSSLAIGGGMALTTTTGTALLVQNGGSVTVTGAGNTIATTGGSAVNITNSTIGAAGVTLQSASSVGGTNTGIVLDNAGSNGFTVTGVGSTTASGGTIANKTGANGATLQGNGLYINNTSNVSLSNMSVTGNQNNGVLGNNDSNFHLTDSTLTNNGNAANEGSVVLNGLTGTSSLLGNVIGGSAGDNVHITTTTGSLNLTIADSANDQAIIGTTNNVTGNDGVEIDTSGSASLTLLIDGVDFQGARGDLLNTNATGSATQDITIQNNIFHNSQATSLGGGVLIAGTAGVLLNVDYRVINNDFTGAAASALTATFQTAAGTIEGYIAGNTIGVADGITGVEGSTGGDGITAALTKLAGAGNADYYLIIANNDIHDINQGNGGIALSSSGGGAGNGANLEATVHDNVINELGANVLTGLYAQVGGSAGSGDFSHLGLALDDNVIDASGALLDAVFLDQISSDAHYSFPGYAGSPDGELYGGNASTDLGVFFATHGNVLISGVFGSFPVGGVDASLIQGADGAPIAPPWYP